MLLEPLGPLPSFISSNPTTQIDIATTNPVHAGIYNFRVKVTDTSTGLTNSDVIFKVIMLKITSVDLVAASAIPDQVYHIGNPAISLTVP